MAIESRLTPAEVILARVFAPNDWNVNGVIVRGSYSGSTGDEHEAFALALNSVKKVVDFARITELVHGGLEAFAVTNLKGFEFNQALLAAHKQLTEEGYHEDGWFTNRVFNTIGSLAGYQKPPRAAKMTDFTPEVINLVNGLFDPKPGS